VWRKRNNKDKNPPAPAAKWSKITLAVGIGSIILSFAWREVIERKGMLASEGLFTVRVPQDLDLDHVAAEGAVKKGDLLARFRSPEREAEIKATELQLETLKAKKSILQSQPLKLDPELVRQIQNAAADKRQFQSSYDQLFPKRDSVSRLGLQERIDAERRLLEIDARLTETNHELEQAAAKLNHVRHEAARSEKLSSQGAASRAEHEENITDEKVLENEVAKLRGRKASLLEEKKQLTATMEEFDALLKRQAAALSKQVDAARANLSAATKQKHTLIKQLQEDRTRAQRLRQRRLEKIDLEIRQCRAELSGLKNSLEKTAPFDGNVVYREPSPHTAMKAAPVVVLAENDSLRVRARLPLSEAKALQQTKTVLFELKEAPLQRRFAGQLLDWEKLPNEPQYALATLACNPPDTAIEQLAEDENIAVHLRWRPPLYLIPFFPFGVALAGLGILAWVYSAWRATRKEEHSEQQVQESGEADSAAAPPAVTQASQPAFETAHTSVEAGAEATVLSILGDRLREGIEREDVQPSILAAIEWALDRHHSRAVRHIRPCLNHENSFHDRSENFLRKLQKDLDGIDDDAHEQEVRRRLIRVLRAVAPEPLRSRVARLDREACQCGPHVVVED
jgi:hypothetical protein